MKSIIYIEIILFILLLGIIQLHWLLKLKSSIIDSTAISYGVSLLFLFLALSFYVKRRYDYLKLFLFFSFVSYFLGFYEKDIESYFMKSAVKNGDMLITEIKKYREFNGEYPEYINNNTIDNNYPLFYRIGIAKEYFFYKREGSGFVLSFNFSEVIFILKVQKAFHGNILIK